MGRDSNTYVKRQREMEKKRKADDKRARRQTKKAETDRGGQARPEISSPQDF